MKRKQTSVFNRGDQIFGKKNDIVKVKGFSVRPVTAKAGQTVTIKMEIMNVSNRSLKNVPWQIVKDKKVLDSGTRFHLPAGESFRVSVSWCATSGSHFIYCDVDPENALNEPRTKQLNNSPQGIDIKVL
jgi:hypothetical protein